MKDKIRVVNKTGLPIDTKVYIGKKQVPLTKTFRVGIVMESDEPCAVHLELFADSVDVIGDNLKGIEKLLNPKI